MRPRLRLFALAALLLLPTIAFAAPGIAMRWDRCYGEGGTANKDFACNTNQGSERLVLSFIPPTDMVKKFWDELMLPGYHKIVAEMTPGKPCEAMRQASRFFRDKGMQSRPTQCHGIDLVTDNPHISAEHVTGTEADAVLKPGMVIMAEPNPITPDGMFGIFLGHTFILTANGRECVDKFPLEIAVAG